MMNAIVRAGQKSVDCRATMPPYTQNDSLNGGVSTKTIVVGALRCNAG